MLSYEELFFDTGDDGATIDAVLCSRRPTCAFCEHNEGELHVDMVSGETILNTVPESRGLDWCMKHCPTSARVCCIGSTT